jgi:hypothetical protein
MREALAEKEEKLGLKGKMREKVGFSVPFRLLG